MDEYSFNLHLERCRHVFEETRCLEIYSYSDSHFDTVEEHPLPPENFENFLYQNAEFTPKILPDGVTRIAGLRMILQQSIKHPEAFSPSAISLPPDEYSRMMAKFHLPFKAIEGSSTVGPFFWTSYDKSHEEMQVIYRRTDEIARSRFNGWELLLSYNFKTNMTTALCRGSAGSCIAKCVKHIKASSAQIDHPMLFPVIMISHYPFAERELGQREARERLRKLERAFAHQPTAPGFNSSFKDEHGLINFDQIIMELTLCHTQVLKKSPVAYLRVLEGFDEAMEIFAQHSSRMYDESPQRDAHAKFSSRIDFYRKKLHGQEYYQSITLQRLEVQRSVLSMSCSLIDNRVTFQIASAQTKLANSSKREAVSQRVIAILGTVFLPGAYLSSLFGTAFFNWQAPTSTTNKASVSPFFWIYWAISVPLTIAVVGSYTLWDRKLSQKASKEDEAIELRMLDMKRKSQNQVIRIANGVSSDRIE